MARGQEQEIGRAGRHQLSDCRMKGTGHGFARVLVVVRGVKMFCTDTAALLVGCCSNILWFVFCCVVKVVVVLSVPLCTCASFLAVLLLEI